MKSSNYFRKISNKLFALISFLLLFVCSQLVSAVEGGAPELISPINDQVAIENTAFNLNVAVNFSGGTEGSPLNFSATGLTPNLNISNDGLISGFVLTADIGDHLIAVTAVDGSGASAIDSFTLSVISNSTLFAMDDQFNGIIEDSVANLLGVLANDTGTGTLQSVSLPDNGGSAVINAGQIEYTPAANFSGDENFSYTITDGVTTSTANVIVSVSNVNDSPVLDSSIGNQTATEAVEFSIDLSTHFSDPDLEDILSFSATGLPSAFSLSDTGVLSGTATFADIGDHLVEVTAVDFSESSSASDTFTLSIIANQDDLAIDDSFTDISEDTSNNILNVLGNDVGNDLTITSTSILSNGGSVVIVGDHLEYTPAPDFAGIEIFTYTVINSLSVTDTATVTVSVLNINDTPVFAPIADQNAIEAELFSLDISIFATDVDADIDLFSATGLPDSLSIDGQGVISGTPRFEDIGIHVITVTATDRRLASASQTFIINVNENANLVARDDYYSLVENSSATLLSVLDNDQGTSLVITQVGVPSAGGSASIIGGASIEYTPAVNFFGSETFTYTIDSAGTSYTASVFVSVSNVDSAPIIATPIADIASHSIGVFFELDISNNFFEPDGQALSFVMSGAPASFSISNGVISGSPMVVDLGSYSVTVTASDINENSVSDTFNLTIIDDPSELARDDFFTGILTDSVDNPLDVLANDITPSGTTLTINFTGATSHGGTVTIVSNSSLLYTPAAGFEGEETFTYNFFTNPGFQQFSANVTVTVTPPGSVNQPPQLVMPIPAQTKNENDNFNLDLNAYFSDDNTTQLNYESTVLPMGLTLSQDGILTGIAQTDLEAGVHLIRVTASDEAGLTTATTFELTINAQNDPPFDNGGLNLDPTEALEDELLSIDLSATFGDEEDDNLNYIATGLPLSISLTAAGLLSGTPPQNEAGSYNVVVTATDSSAAAVSKSFQLIVVNVNDAPEVIVPLTDEVVNEETPYSRDISGAFTDIDGDTLTFSASGLPASLSMTATGLISGVTQHADVGNHLITITAQDPAGATVQDQFNLQVLDVLHAPVINPIADQSTDEFILLTFTASASDADAQDTLTYSIINAIPDGASLNPVTGLFSWTPNETHGGNSYVLTVQVSDNTGLTDSTSVNIFVNEIDNAPIANDDFATLDEDTLITVAVLANDSDDVSLVPASVSITQAASSGQVSIDSVTGDITYQPDENFNGSDFLRYTVSDPAGNVSNEATVSFTVNSVNDAPEFVTNPELLAVVDENYLYVFNAVDVDGDAITYSATILPTWLTFNSVDQTFTGIPAEIDIGVHSVVLMASDGVVETEQAFSIEVLPNTLADLELTLTVKSPAHRAKKKANLKAVIYNHGPDIAHNVLFTAEVFGDATVKGPGYCDVIVDVSVTTLTCEYALIEVDDRRNVNFTVQSDEIAEIYVVTQVSSVDDSELDNNIASTTLSFTNRILDRVAASLDSTEVVLVGDMDSDGKKDILLVGNENNAVIIWRQKRFFRFEKLTEFGSADSSISDAVLLDVDADGDLDLVVATNSENGNLLYRNNSGTFSAELLGNEIARALLAEDLDDNGTVDLVMAADGGNSVYLNDGSSLSFVHSLGNADSRDLALLDIDNDNKLDVVFANVGSDIMVYLNQAILYGTGTISVEDMASGRYLSAYPLMKSGGSKQIGKNDSIAIAKLDFNSDGKVDLIFSSDGKIKNKQLPSNRLLENFGSNGFKNVGNLGASMSTQLKPFDYNGDGYKDILTLNKNGAHQIFMGQGSTLEKADSIIVSKNAKSVAVGDLDNDGLADLIIASDSGSHIFANNGGFDFGFANTDLKLTLESDSSIYTGVETPYKIVVENNGNNFAEDIEVQIEMDTQLTLKSFSGVGANCIPNVKGVLCNLSTIESFDKMEVVLMMVALNVGEVELLANVISSNNDLDISNNKTQVNVSVEKAEETVEQASNSGSGSLLYLLVCLSMMLNCRKRI